MMVDLGVMRLLFYTKRVVSSLQIWKNLSWSSNRKIQYYTYSTLYDPHGTYGSSSSRDYESKNTIWLIL